MPPVPSSAATRPKRRSLAMLAALAVVAVGLVVANPDGSAEGLVLSKDITLPAGRSARPGDRRR